MGLMKSDVVWRDQDGETQVTTVHRRHRDGGVTTTHPKVGGGSLYRLSKEEVIAFLPAPANKPGRKPLYQFVEQYEDGTELVRHTGTYQMCALLQRDFERAGFRGEVRLITKS